MKTIINNRDKLEKKEINITTNKVRAIILNDNNEILVTKYADMYMLPGGKVDENESLKNALIRELNEELGIRFNINELSPFIQFENYLKDYPLVNSNIKINKLSKTTYFIIKTNKKINYKNLNLTEREKNNNFSATYLNLNNVFNIIYNYKSNNERNNFFKDELIKVLEELNSTKNQTLEELEKVIDLHTHTNYSDGELSPNELIKYAIKNNISTLAITDHDTIEGLKTIDKDNSLIIDSGIKLINGIELSAKIDKGRMHILGYGIDIYNNNLNKKMIELKNISINYVLSIIEQLKNDYDIFFTYEEIKNLVNSNNNLGRPDIARLLVKKGYTKTVQEAFDKYLINIHSKLGKRKKGIPYNECINLILKSNGIPVLAHPKTLELNDKELLYLLKNMIKCGLMGIEVYHSNHTQEEINKYLEIANELNLLVSGGSDYHGINTKPDIEIGSGKNNNLKIKQLSILQKLK